MKLKFLSYKLLWVIIGIPLVSYLILKPSFNLSLFGDDWEQLYFMYLEFDVRHSFSRFDIKSYLGPYNFSYAYLGILNNFFGLNSAAYFYTSFILRALATISIYLLVNFISKEKLAGFLASILFIFSVAGLETTDWVFNMNTYLGIFLFNLSLILYLKIRSITKLDISAIVSIALFIFLFTSSLIIVSTRLHGAVPFIILMDLGLVLLFEKKIPNIYFFLRISLPVLILLLAMHIGAFGHLGSGGFTDRLKLGFDTAQALLQKGEYLFLFFLPGLIGHIALPDHITGLYLEKLPFSITTIIYLTALSAVIFLTVNTPKLSKIKKNLSLLSFFIFTFIWTLLVFLVHKLNPNIGPDKFFSILIGGEALFLVGYLSFILKAQYSNLSFTLLFSFLYLISFSLIYWLFSPAVFFETTSRYLIMGAVGFAIFFATLLSFLIKAVKPNLMVVPLLILLSWLFANFWASHQYLTFLEINRNSKTAVSIWKSLTDSITNLDTENPTVFFFTTDNPFSLHWNVVFGFPSHMGLTYKVPNLNNTPLPVTDYPTLLAYVRDGSPQKMNGRPIKPIPLDHVYAYHLSGDKLFSQTDLIREKIKQDLKIP